MSKTIRVDEDTYAALTELKDEDESYDDLLARLVTERPKAVDAGLWGGAEAESARKARSEMKENVDHT